ncbi:hypothetical protein F5887DRAFT_1068668 [Amanita rubescens]|nr:hypothetical protein F5887DRAFT_1068668 [Amanita rubescens]
MSPADISQSLGADYWNSMVNTQGQRWCIPTEDWTGPGGIKLDEPIRWKLRDDVASWLAAKQAGLLTGVDPSRPGSPDYVPFSIPLFLSLGMQQVWKGAEYDYWDRDSRARRSLAPPSLPEL